ncbi:MAG: hypothetical protein ACREIQ_09815 [Nitrospiria bacterium]
MKPEEYSEHKIELGGWPVNIVTYRLGSTFYTTVENNDPGAWVVKGEGKNRGEAESKALKEAEALLAKVRKTPPPTGCTSVPGF